MKAERRRFSFGQAHPLSPLTCVIVIESASEQHNFCLETSNIFTATYRRHKSITTNIRHALFQNRSLYRQCPFCLSLILSFSIYLFFFISLQSCLLILASTGNTVRSSASLERCTQTILSSSSSLSSTGFYYYPTSDMNAYSRWLFLEKNKSREKARKRERYRDRDTYKTRRDRRRNDLLKHRNIQWEDWCHFVDNLSGFLVFYRTCRHHQDLCQASKTRDHVRDSLGSRLTSLRVDQCSVRIEKKLMNSFTGIHSPELNRALSWRCQRFIDSNPLIPSVERSLANHPPDSDCRQAFVITNDQSVISRRLGKGLDFTLEVNIFLSSTPRDSLCLGSLSYFY
jgi:hypothetical protein